MPQDVNFNEPDYNYGSRSASPSRKQSFLTRLALASGLAKDEAGAQRVLLIAAIVIAVIAIAVFFLGQSSTPSPASLPTPAP